MRAPVIAFAAFLAGACSAASYSTADPALEARVAALEAESLQVHVALWGHQDNSPPEPGSFFDKAENGDSALIQLKDLVDSIRPVQAQGLDENIAMTNCYRSTCPQ